MTSSPFSPLGADVSSNHLEKGGRQLGRPPLRGRTARPAARPRPLVPAHRRLNAGAGVQHRPQPGLGRRRRAAGPSPLAHRAASFLKQAEMPIQPKAQVAANAFVEYGFRGNLPQNLRAREGRVLSRWGDAGWGGMVAKHKHANHFGDELVEAMAEMIQQRWQPAPAPTWVCCVPSRNHPELVPDFARRLAARLALPFVDAVAKVRDNQPQKGQQNRFHQCRNLDGVFTINLPVPSGAVLLIDDIVDSGWTLTVLAALLQQAGSGAVFPVALASSSVSDS